MNYTVALDGPSGAGKSTIAKLVAAKLNIVYVDTGALYRAITLYMLNNNINVEVETEVVANLVNVKIALEYKNGEQIVLLNGENVSKAIRENRVSIATSKVSAYKEVRDFLLNTQRDLADTTSLIMDGRDIGTVVLPNSKVKIFMVASPEIRAMRRYKELINKGEQVEYSLILEDINQRDYNDTHREQAPLKQAQDAVLLDTGDMNLEQVVEKVVNIINEKVDK